MPESTGLPPQAAWNLTGIVLPNLNARTGLAKLPPVESAPPIGGRKPVKSSAARVTVNEQLALLVAVSVAVQITVVEPTGKSDPEAGVQLADATAQLSET